METEMKKTFVATAAIVFAFAAPALAQSYDPDLGSGNLDSAPYASDAGDVIDGDRTIYRRPVRRAPSKAYAQSPGKRVPPTTPLGGYRWPGARYDEHGYYIDPNSPGRW
jgi:hypothetical protein